MAVGALPVGPINLSDDGPEDENRFDLSEGIQEILFKCIAECSDDQVHWYDIGNSIAREQTEVLQQLQEILMTSRCGPGASGHDDRGCPSGHNCKNNAVKPARQA